MTLQVRKIFDRFFPKKFAGQRQNVQQWEGFSEAQKKAQALHYLIQGELALLQGNLGALPLFESAAELDPQNPELWYRQGLALFEYGSEEGREKSLLLASRCFKMATGLKSDYFDAWTFWGNTLLQLGKFHEDHNFLLESKEKYQKAFDLAEGQPNDALAELHWDYGIAWMEISAHSGEALDLRLAIDSFHKSLQLQDNPAPELFRDCGNAYLEMGLLVNDTRHYFQAIQYLQNAVDIEPQYFDGWLQLGEAYSQAYINTMDERLIPKASFAYSQAVKISPRNADAWVDWAQILAESGKLGGNVKLLRQSIEKCARAASCNPDDPLITAQWVESLSILGSLTHRLDLLVEAEQKILKATEAEPNEPDLWHAYGVCLIAFGRYFDDPDYFELAIDRLQDALSIDRTSAEHWQTLGLVHKLYGDTTEHADLLERACRFFSLAMEIKPACPSLLFDAACALLSQSKLTGHLPSLQQALGHFETLISNHKEALLSHPEWMFEYASALEWLFEFSPEETYLVKAAEIFSHVLLIDPDFPDIHHRIACCYVELGHTTFDLEHYKRATTFFRLALRQDEENDHIWHDLGLCLIHLGEQTSDPDLRAEYYWDAEQKISQAGALGNSAALYSLACLYSLQSKTQEAMTFIHKSLGARALPPIDEMLDDEWLENLCATEEFVQFLEALEARLQQMREQ